LYEFFRPHLGQLPPIIFDSQMMIFRPKRLIIDATGRFVHHGVLDTPGVVVEGRAA
jgi:hypothetical protein